MRICSILRRMTARLSLMSLKVAHEFLAADERKKKMRRLLMANVCAFVTRATSFMTKILP